MEEILTKQELTFLTTFKSNKRIVAWLIKNHIPFMLAGDSSPRVNRNVLANMMGAAVSSKPPIAVKDYSKLEGFK